MWTTQAASVRYQSGLHVTELLFDVPEAAARRRSKVGLLQVVWIGDEAEESVM